MHTRYNTLCINYQICLGNANNKIMVCWQNLQELSLYVLQIIFNEIDAKLHQFNQNVSTNCLFDCTCFLCNSQIHLFVVHKMIPFFSNFSCMFLNPNNFFPIWIFIVLIYQVWETSRNKLKKHSVSKNCSDLSLFEQPWISKVFLGHWNNFFSQWSEKFW